MAEPTERTRTRLAEVFLPAYNAIHGSLYRNPAEPERAGTPYDFRWVTTARPSQALEVQLTVGALDPKRDRIHPKLVGRLTKRVEEWAMSEIPTGYAISLRIPRGKQRGKQPVPLQRLTSFVLSKLQEGVAQNPPPGLRLRLHQLRPYAGDDWPEVELERLNGETGTFIVSVPEPFGYIPLSVPRLREAVDRKQASLRGRPSEMVLLVYFDVDGYQPEDIGELRGEIADDPVNYREIWGVSLWSSEERADRLWP